MKVYSKHTILKDLNRGDYFVLECDPSIHYMHVGVDHVGKIIALNLETGYADRYRFYEKVIRKNAKIILEEYNYNKTRKKIEDKPDNFTFIVKYTNKSGNGISISNIIDENEKDIITYLDYYGIYDDDQEIADNIDGELDNIRSDSRIVTNGCDVLFLIESRKDFCRLSIVDFNYKNNTGNKNLEVYSITN